MGMHGDPGVCVTDRQKCYQLHQHGLVVDNFNRPKRTFVDLNMANVRVFPNIFEFVGVVSGFSTDCGAHLVSYDHTTVRSPHPIRTAKLSTVGPN